MRETLREAGQAPGPPPAWPQRLSLGMKETLCKAGQALGRPPAPCPSDLGYAVPPLPAPSISCFLHRLKGSQASVYMKAAQAGKCGSQSRREGRPASKGSGPSFHPDLARQLSQPCALPEAFAAEPAPGEAEMPLSTSLPTPRAWGRRGNLTESQAHSGHPPTHPCGSATTSSRPGAEDMDLNNPSSEHQPPRSSPE